MWDIHSRPLAQPIGVPFLSLHLIAIVIADHHFDSVWSLSNELFDSDLNHLRFHPELAVRKNPTSLNQIVSCKFHMDT